MASAALFSAPNHTRLRRPHSNLLSPGSNPFSCFAWVKLHSYADGVSVINPTICGQWSAVGNQREWRLGYSTDNSCFYSQWCSDGINDNNLYSTFGQPALNTWYMVGITYTNPTVYISVNAGAEQPNGVATYFTGGSDFYVCHHQSVNFGTPHDNYLDAAVCSLGYWGGRRLADADRTELFNGGHALQFANLSANLKTNLTMFHDLLGPPPYLDGTSNHLDLFGHAPVGLGLPPP
jgi:hypothetical protein